jgi:hypothetical protein
MHSYINVVGSIAISRILDNGEKELVRDYPNLVVAAGKTFIANRIAANTALVDSIAVGVGETSAVSTDTELETEIDRSALSTNATVIGPAITYTSNFGNANANGTLSEVGLFSNSTLVCRSVFPPYTKSSNEAIAVSWTLTVV